MGHRNFGSLDYKGTNYAHFQQLRFHAIGGPTYGGPSDIPPFRLVLYVFEIKNSFQFKAKINEKQRIKKKLNLIFL